MKDGFIKVAAVTPLLRVADCAYNASQIIQEAQRAHAQQSQLLVTPELGITGYTCGDLFFQRSLQQGALKALQTICESTGSLPMLLVVGLPLHAGNALYNCAAVLYKGDILGIVPKQNIPANGEIEEARYFCAAPATNTAVSLPFSSVPVPFGCNLLFECQDLPDFTLAVEIGHDLFAPVSPSASHTNAGATVLAVPAAQPQQGGTTLQKNKFITSRSSQLTCAYIYANAGLGESTTDVVFSGHNIIVENGDILAQTAPFAKDTMAITEIDVQYIGNQRIRGLFQPQNIAQYQSVSFSLPPIQTALTRHIAASCFIPQDEQEKTMYFEEVLSVQAAGLARRVSHVKPQSVILGLSGGLDSALALLVAVRAYQMLSLPLSQIHTVTMPAFGTTSRTRNNAQLLAEALGLPFQEIDITSTVRSHFSDIKQSENKHDVTYENAQARVRTLVLMDLANQQNGLVVGTGDLSELALGWATYNGDHMSMYSVNASIPKTLVRQLVAYEASQNPAIQAVLQDILDTPVSPELLPAIDNEIAQHTEDLVGPYELHDFTLYYMLACGFSPKKIFRLASHAFANSYDDATILHWMKTFYRRFFTQQFKRNCMPDGPKATSIGLSPRGEWIMPSDAVATLWMDELEQLG